MVLPLVVLHKDSRVALFLVAGCHQIIIIIIIIITSTIYDWRRNIAMPLQGRLTVKNYCCGRERFWKAQAVRSAIEMDKYNTTNSGICVAEQVGLKPSLKWIHWISCTQSSRKFVPASGASSWEGAVTKPSLHPSYKKIAFIRRSKS